MTKFVIAQNPYVPNDAVDSDEWYIFWEGNVRWDFRLDGGWAIPSDIDGPFYYKADAIQFIDDNKKGLEP